MRPLDRTDAKLLGFALLLTALVLVLVDLIGDAVVAGVLQ